MIDRDPEAEALIDAAGEPPPDLAAEIAATLDQLAATVEAIGAVIAALEPGR